MTKRILLLMCIVALYYPTLAFDYIQDDWGILYALKFGSFADLFSGLFFRPIGALYFAALYGSGAWLHHVMAIAIHFATSLIVIEIAHKFTKNCEVVGFFYACSAMIFLDPLSWMVGFYDLGGALFFFGAMLLFIRGKQELAVGVYILALLTKEATVILPLILLAYTYEKRYPDKAIVLAPFFFLMCIYIGLKLLLMQIDAAYSMSVGLHVFENLYKQITWVAFPALVVLSIVAGIVFGRRTTFYIVWMVVALLPVIFLENHSYRYYFIYGLPAFYILTCAWAETKYLAVAFWVFFFGNLIFMQTLDQHPFTEGMNNLHRKDKETKLVREYIKNQQPRSGTTFFIPANTGIFLHEKGLRVWYNDSTLNVRNK